MARGLGGFAEGFQGGFGLVNDFYAQKSREKYQDEISKYRQDSLQVEREADIRKGKHEGDLLAESVKRTGIAADTKTATDKEIADAAAWRKEQERLNAELRGKQEENINLGLQIKKGELDELGAAAIEARNERRDVEVARHVNRAHQIAAGGDMEALEDYTKRFGEFIFNRESFMGLGQNLNPYREEASAHFTQDLAKLAQGQLTPGKPEDDLTELSDQSMSYMTYMINKEHSGRIGEIINLEDYRSGTPGAYVNAPPSFEGARILNSGVLNLQSDTNLAISGKVFVEVQLKDGTNAFYTAPMTQNAQATTSKMVELGADTGMQSHAALSNYGNWLRDSPMLIAQHKTYLKNTEHGGVEKFDAKVTNKVTEIFDKFKESVIDPESDADGYTSLGMGSAFAGKTVSQILDDVEFVEEAVRKRMLYGEPAVDKLQRAKKYFNDIEQKVPIQRWSNETGGTNALGRGSKARSGTIDDLVIDGFAKLEQNQKVHINNLLRGDGDGTVSPEELNAVVDYLDDIEKLKKDLSGWEAGYLSGFRKDQK